MLGDRLPRPSQLPSPCSVAAEDSEHDPSTPVEMLGRPSSHTAAHGEADESLLPKEAPATPAPGSRGVLPPPTHRRLSRQLTRKNSISAATRQRLDAVAGREERAAIKIQSVLRGRWIRKLRLAKDCIVEQQAAITRLRAQRRSSNPGKQAMLEAGGGQAGVLRDSPHSKVKTLRL